MNNDKMEYIDGKFIKNGIVIPPAFGDKDQIELLNNLNEIKSAVKSGEYDIPCWECGDEDTPFFINFQCTCGRSKQLKPKPIVTEVESSVELSLSHNCECGQTWKAKSEEGFFYNFKIVKPKKR